MLISIQSPEQPGKAIRSTRKGLGLTQPELALVANVGVRFMVELEAGKPTVRLEYVLRVIDALGGEMQLANMTTDHASDADQYTEPDS